MDFKTEIERLIERAAPRSILVISPNDPRSHLDIERHRPRCRVDYIADDNCMAQLEGRERYDLGLIYGVLERVDKSTGEVLIGRMRDLYARQFYVLAPLTPAGVKDAWRPTDFLAFGMRRLGEYKGDAGTRHLYAFDIDSYKTTPEWLNARHWAHPELWDKHRW